MKLLDKIFTYKFATLNKDGSREKWYQHRISLGMPPFGSIEGPSWSWALFGSLIMWLNDAPLWGWFVFIPVMGFFWFLSSKQE